MAKKQRTYGDSRDDLLQNDSTDLKKKGKYAAGKGKTSKKDGFKQMVDDESDDPKPNFKRTEDAETWSERFDLALRNEKPMKKKWAEWYEMMYAIKTYKNIGVWKSQGFIPVMSYKAWTIIAKLLALRPGFAVKIYDELYSNEDRKYIDKANLKLEFDYDNPMLDESIRDKEFDIFTDATVCGTGFGKAEWVSGTRTYYKHFQKDDGTIDYSKADKEEVDYGYNDLEPVNAFDVYSSPGKRSFEAKPWHMIKYRKTRADLLASDMYDEKVVNALRPIGKSRDVITKYKQSRNQFIGDTGDDQDSLDDTVDSFDVFECYEKTPEGIFLMTFAVGATTPGEKGKKAQSGDEGSWYEIRNEKQPYWHNKYPLVPAYIRRRPHDCWGESIFEITESMANAYNDLFNQLADNVNIVGNGGILMHETSTTIYDFYYAPGGEVRYSGTKPEFETPESPDIRLFDTMFGLLDSGITNATVSPYATGTPSDGNDDTQGTAKGISLLQEAAGEITSFMKGSIMQFLKGVGSRWLENNRQFLDEAITISQTRYGKKTVYRITSDDFMEKMMLDIDEDSMNPATPQQRREDDMAWLNSMVTIQDRSLMQAGLKPNPASPPEVDPATGQPIPPQPVAGAKPIMLDWQKIAADISEDYGKPDIDEFLIDPTSADNENADNTGMIEAIRELVKDGQLDGGEAQSIIDLVEGRTPSSPVAISQGDENEEPTPEELTAAATDAGTAADQVAIAA